MSDSNGPRDEDLARTAGDLADSLRELRDEVGPRRRPRRGPFGLPRPPTPREVLQFTDEVAIPATIAILEVNIKLLEAVQKAIRLAETERRAREQGEEVADRAREGGRAVRSGAGRVGRETLDQLDNALDELQTAVEEGSLPREETAREILTEARELRADLEAQVRDAEDTADEQRRRERENDREAGGERGAGISASDDDGEDDPPSDETDGEEDETGPQVDVDAELRSIKDQYDDEDDDK